MGEGLLTMPRFPSWLIKMVIIMVILGDAIVFFPSNVVIQMFYGGHMVIILT